MLLVEQELLTPPEHLSSHPVVNGVRVTRYFVLCMCFVDRCLSVCTFPLAIVLSVLLRYTNSDYPIGILKLFLYSSQPACEKIHPNQHSERLAKTGSPHITSQREDRALHRLVRRIRFATCPVLKRQWLPNRLLSARTMRNRLKSAGLKSRRVIKRPMLSDRHQRLRLASCLARRGLNLGTCRRIHWSDESRFLLHVTD